MKEPKGELELCKLPYEIVEIESMMYKNGSDGENGTFCERSKVVVEMNG
jgi:hypothetical protein